jgi:hypothetical protein
VPNLTEAKSNALGHRLSRRWEASNCAGRVEMEAWLKIARFRVTLGFFSVGHDRAHVVAGLCEAGCCRISGVTDPGYNSRCYLALNHVEMDKASPLRRARFALLLAACAAPVTIPE